LPLREIPVEFHWNRLGRVAIAVDDELGDR
jgi:hypothetical protein